MPVEVIKYTLATFPKNIYHNLDYATAKTATL